MIGTLSIPQKLTSLCLIAALALTNAGMSNITTPPPAPTPQADATLFNATIKTQDAADRLVAQGASRGIDVSKYQGSINWRQVANDDVDFVFVRASYGMTKDPYFLTNARQAHEHGLRVGAYHYATFETRAEMLEEAEYFLSRVRQVDITYPLVLDFESSKYQSMGRSSATKLAAEFMDIIKNEGYSIMLYSYNNFIRDYLSLDALQGYDLWIANYLEQPSVANHKVWQHTASGRVNGIAGNVDINIAYDGNLRSATKAASTSSSSSSSRNSSSSSSGKAASSTVKVSKTVSNSIKATLNSRYNVGLPTEGLNMTQMNTAIAKGIQAEIARQWEINLDVTGKLSTHEMSLLDEVSWSSSTRGHITYLIQAKLFYYGYYQGALTSQYDSNTMDAISAFQANNSLVADGYLDYDTLCAIFL